MRRLITGFAVLVFALLVAGCGVDEPCGPAVTVAWGDEFEAPGIMTATLTPQESPRGALAFRLVRNGQVTTLARYRFAALSSPGTAQLQLHRRAVDGVWTLPGGGIGKKRVHVALPRGSRSFGRSWSGLTLRASEDEGELVIWADPRYVGRLPDSDSLPMGHLDSLVANSLQHPRRVVYCLTLEVKAP